MKYVISLALAMVFFIHSSKAQMPHDGIYMNKKLACGALIYSHSSWTNYWENRLFRENLNIGRLTTESMMAMVAYGITKKINAIAVFPYVQTNASQGNLMGQKGFQDLSFWLKAKAFSKQGISIHGAIGYSTPLSNYVPDFMPMSIGMGANSLITRGIITYDMAKHLYLNGSIAYQMRSQVKVDRDAYLHGGKLYQTNEVPVPDAFDAAFRFGYLKKDNQLELFAETFSCTKGDDIRRNDMPFLTNDMSMTTVGIYGKYQPKHLGVNAKVSYVVDGQNVGQSLNVSLGILYIIKL